MTFGSRIRDLRKARDLSLRELAGRVGIDFTYLSKVENDRVPPPAEDTIVRLARELQADADELLLLASRIPSDLAEEIVRSPKTVEMLRTMEHKVYTPEEWADLIRLVKEKGSES